jgi:carbonic anhydrase
MKEKFATAINCIDGRVQSPIAEWIMFHHNVEYVDMITEPGVDRVLSEGKSSQIASMAERLQVSIQAHQSGLVAIVGHHNCAANIATPEEHKKQIQDGAEIVASWNFGIRVIGLYVNEWNSIDLICDNNEGFVSTKNYL